MLNHADLRLDLPGRRLEPGLIERWIGRLRPPAPVQPAAPASAPHKLEGGQMVAGRWRLETRLGCGAFGEVWAGADAHSGAPVALKFARSARRRRHLRHEAGIVGALQAGPELSRFVAFEDDAARPCLVLERGGENVSAHRQRLPGRRLPARDALRLGLGMLHAIDAVHRRGLVHRDVKNANFVFIGEPRLGRCQLIDFGLARRWPDGGDPAPAPAGRFAGTPRYASLHVHAGLRAGPRDDLWSWCYALMQLLGGDLPWQSLKQLPDIAAAKQEQLRGGASALPMPQLLLPVTALLDACGPDQRPDTAQLRARVQAAIERQGDD